MAGGVGTSTWCRTLQLYLADVASGARTSSWYPTLQTWFNMPVNDLGALRHAGTIDFLVTSNTVAATSRIGEALNLATHRPVLIIMNTTAVNVRGSRAYLRMVDPNVTARFTIDHHREWLESEMAPGSLALPGMKDVDKALEGFMPALRRTYTEGPRRIPASPAPGIAVSPYPARPVSAKQTPLSPRAGPSGGQRWVPQPSGAPAPGFRRGGQGG